MTNSVITFILSLLQFFAPTRYVFSKQIHNSNDYCRFEGQVESLWRHCYCISVGGNTSIHVICRQIPATTLLPLPSGETNSTVLHIVALSMTEGDLVFLHQDAFRLQNIQSLDFSNNEIQTINVNAFRGLEMKLTQLNLSNNNLSVIPSWALTYLHQLQFLHLDNNRITHVRSNTFDETQLNNLQFLHLDNNQITYIPKFAFHRLRLIVLTLSNNRISQIEKMSLPPTLCFLDLRNNLLTQLPYLALKELSSLQSLMLEGNNITMLDYNPEVNFKKEIKLILRNNKIRFLSEKSFKSFKRLRELDLSYNQISKVYQNTFETVSHIRHLDLSYNYIAYIPHGTLKNFAKNLERLNLEENVIHTLPDALRDLHNLTYLNLSGNKLNKLDDSILMELKPTLKELIIAYNQLKGVPTNVLNGMEQLQHLDLSKNRIQSVERLAFGTLDSSGTSLIILNLSGNQIKNITDPGVFLYMSSLAYLDLSYNQIENIGTKAFEKLPGLEKLFLQNNQLEDFPLSSLQRTIKLRQIILDNNKIDKLPSYILGHLPFIEHLSLAGNRIQVIDDKMFHASTSKDLKILNLATNQISTLSNHAFVQMENLQTLKLNNNKLKVLPSTVFAELRNLRHLDLSENEIVKILPHTFTNLPVIETILLHNNKIIDFENNVFYQMNKVETLDLSHNLIQIFPCEYLGTIHIIANLDLSHNQITQLDLSCIKGSLNRLSLSHNNLQMIRKEMVQDAYRLNELSLSHNGILEIQNHALDSCPRLKTIDLSHNHIRIIRKGTFAHQEMLSHLDLSWNAITSIQRGSLGKNNILSLNLMGNDLARIPIDAFETTSASLTNLNMDTNRIRIIDSPQLVGLRNLTWLALSNNQIETVEDAAFEHLSELNDLDISHNPISTWSPTAFRDLSHGITTVNLAKTGLFSIPKINNRAVRHLNISWNKIYELSKKDLTSMNKLTILDISYNNLKSLDIDAFVELIDLKHLNISGNHISQIYEDHMKSLYRLESLYMQSMPSLKSLPQPYAFTHLSNLKKLNMFGLPDSVQPYNITDILRHLPPLRSLSIELKDEVLNTQLHQADMRLLRELTITGRNLTYIDVGAFYMLRGYRVHLTIRNTSLNMFPSTIFNTLSSINFLVLSLPNNHLKYINPFKSTVQPVINQHGTILQSLDISGNPIHCDCTMSWVTKWLHNIDNKTRDFSNVFCHSGTNKESLSTAYHPESNIIQCQPTDKLSRSNTILLLIYCILILKML